MKVEILKNLEDLEDTIAFITKGEHEYTNASIDKNTFLFNTFFCKRSQVVNVLDDDDNILATVTLTDPLEDLDMVYFGFYELPENTPDRDEVRKLLFSEVTKVLDGKTSIIGPIKFTTWLDNRYRTGGTDKVFFWEPAQNDLYVNDLKTEGFIEDAQYITNFYHTGEELLTNTKPHYDNCINDGYVFGDISIESEEEQSQLYELNCICFSQNYLYTAVSFEQYRDTHLAALKDFDFTYCSYITKDNVPQGYIFCFVDQGELVIKTILISPNARNAGLASAMVHEIVKRGKERGVTKGAGALVRKGNISEKWFRSLAKPIAQHTYSLYKKDL